MAGGTYEKVGYQAAEWKQVARRWWQWVRWKVRGWISGGREGGHHLQQEQKTAAEERYKIYSMVVGMTHIYGRKLTYLRLYMEHQFTPEELLCFKIERLHCVQNSSMYATDIFCHGLSRTVNTVSWPVRDWSAVGDIPVSIGKRKALLFIENQEMHMVITSFPNSVIIHGHVWKNTSPSGHDSPAVLGRTALMMTLSAVEFRANWIVCKGFGCRPVHSLQTSQVVWSNVND